MDLSSLFNFAMNKLNNNQLMENQASKNRQGAEYLQTLRSGDKNAIHQKALEYLQSQGVGTDDKSVQNFLQQKVPLLANFFHYNQ